PPSAAGSSKNSKRVFCSSEFNCSLWVLYPRLRGHGSLPNHAHADMGMAPETDEVGVLLSMTGYGEARYQSDQLSLSIELRALNNRYLKVSLRASDPYHLLEAEFEKVIRRTVRRGTIQAHLRCERQATPQDFRIDPVALASYVQQIRDICQQLKL